jgi:hypothetical protein
LDPGVPLLHKGINPEAGGADVILELMSSTVSPRKNYEIQHSKICISGIIG